MHRPPELAATVAEAIMQRRPLPAMTCRDLAEGYQLQAAVSDLINNGQQAGFKAGLTSSALQKHFGLQAPLLASIYLHGKLESGCRLTAGQKQQIECEIGAIVDSNGNPIALLPIVELVYLEFSRAEDFTIANAVAANLGADRYLCGAISPWDKSLQTLTVTIEKDGIFHSTQSNQYSFGAPEAGLRWMVDEAKKRDLWHNTKQNKIMLLGTCGEAFQAEAGNYKISFGTLGDILFSIEP